MIWLLLALAAPQAASPEPQTRAELDAVSSSYLSARFDVEIRGNGIVCNSTPSLSSTTLVVGSCRAALTCLTAGERDPAKLVDCIERAKPALLKAFRRDWLKAHPQ